MRSVDGIINVSNERCVSRSESEKRGGELIRVLGFDVAKVQEKCSKKYKKRSKKSAKKVQDIFKKSAQFIHIFIFITHDKFHHQFVF